MNPMHRSIIKRLSLRDKEAESRLVGLYYATPHDERAALLVKMSEVSGDCAGEIKRALLEPQDIEEACRAQLYDEVERYKEETGEATGGEDEAPVKELRREDPRGPNGAA